jgi:hypothetical protein
LNLSQKLKELWGFYPLMLIGCAGDSSNHNDRLGRDFAELERVTTELAAKINQIKIERTLSIDNQRLRVLTLNQEVVNDKEAYDQELLNRIEGN